MSQIQKKLRISNKSPFATGPLADRIGPYGDNDIVYAILDGTVTHKLLGISPNEVHDELYALLTALQYVTTPTGDKVAQTNNMISLDDYKNLVSKTGEMTASSPSKTHMCHCIA